LSRFCGGFFVSGGSGFVVLWWLRFVEIETCRYVGFKIVGRYELTVVSLSNSGCEFGFLHWRHAVIEISVWNELFR
jgi:hypothetical protein